jgi:hypothetical protein
VGLEWGSPSLVSTIEELLERKVSGSGPENRDYGRRGSAALTTRHPSIRKSLALTSPTSGGRSVSIVRSRTQATEFFFFACKNGAMALSEAMLTRWLQYVLTLLEDETANNSLALTICHFGVQNISGICKQTCLHSCLLLRLCNIISVSAHPIVWLRSRTEPFSNRLGRQGCIKPIYSPCCACCR